MVGVDSGTDDASFVAQVSSIDSVARSAGDVGSVVVGTGVIPFNACCTRTVCAGLMVSLLPWACGSGEALPPPSGPQMTRRIGKSFAQLLTSSAVLIALGLAGDGGGRGSTVWTGPFVVRRSGFGGGGGEMWFCDVPDCWWFSPFVDGEGTRLALGFKSLLDAFGEGLDGVAGSLGSGKHGETGVVGFDGGDADTPWALEARLDAKRRTVRWCASVATAFRLRKKRYCTMIGARVTGDAVRDWDFSMRAQVK